MLPTPEMGWDSFEAFLDDLLVRLRLVRGAIPRLVTSSRYGKAGQDQAGIDHLGAYDDDTTATWQCKEQLKLTEANVRKIIKDTEVAADKHVIVFSRVADAKARTEAAKQSGWSIWDQNDLANLVRTLPVHEARTLLDAHFGSAARRQFLPIAGTDVFLGLEEFYGPLLRTDRRFHHRTSLVGRADDVAALVSGLTDPDGPSIIAIGAPAGRGKSRFVLEVLREVQRNQATVPVLVRAEQRMLDSGALQELPDGPTTLLVEDAHRDPVGVAAVLQYARRTAGVRVVITSRPSGAAPVLAAAITAQFDLSEIFTHTLEPLSARSARDLVKELCGDDLTLPGPFAEALAQAARSTPIVAVVATSMLRRGELSSGLALDERFRDEILSRYGQVITDGVPDLSAADVRSTLALIAALAPVDLEDATLLDAMAQFQNTTLHGLLDVMHKLIDHGVLLERGRRLRVIPDVLADEALTTHTVRLGVDTGYASRIWEAFGTAQTATVVRNLAELDWRIRTGVEAPRGNAVSDVFAGVWHDVRTHVLDEGSAGRSAALTWLAAVAGSQSDRVFGLVQDMLAAPADSGRTADMSAFELTHDDVRRHVAPLLRTCAAANADLLGGVLNQLWALARQDARPPNQDGDHPARIIEDIGNLGRSAALQTARVIIDSVRGWLSTPDPADAPRTPLFALEPLLAKEGMTQDWQPNALNLLPHMIDAKRVKSVRDQVRGLLRPIAAGNDVRRAIAAIHLLGAALREPSGLLGQTVTASAVLSWEEDDQSTIAVLEEVAASTGEPLIRLAIRDAVDWHAVRATSAVVRARCLTLVEQLDAHIEDVLTDLLLGKPGSILPPHGQRAAFAAAPETGTGESMPATSAGTDGSLTPEGFEELEEFDRRRQRELSLVASQLWTTSTPTQIVQTLTGRLNVIATAREEDGANGTGQLLAALASEHPERIVELLDAIQETAGPLDGWVATLLNALASHDQQAFLHALTSLTEARSSLANGALYGFRTYRWVSVIPATADILARALDHPDKDVALQAVAGMGELLKTDVQRHSARLAAMAGEHPAAVRVALRAASGHRPTVWITSLSDDERAAILAVVASLPKWDWSTQHTVAAVAEHLPDLVLQMLTNKAVSDPAGLPRDVDGLAAAMSAHADSLAAWVRTAALSTGLSRWSHERVWPLIAGKTLSPGAETAVQNTVAHGTPEELSFLAGALAQCEGFVLNQVEIVTLLIKALNDLPDETREPALAALRMSAHCHGYSRTPGQPAPEYVKRRDLARTISERTDLPDLAREFYTAVTDDLQHRIDEDLRQDAAEDNA